MAPMRKRVNRPQLRDLLKDSRGQTQPLIADTEREPRRRIRLPDSVFAQRLRRQPMHPLALDRGISGLVTIQHARRGGIVHRTVAAMDVTSQTRTRTVAANANAVPAVVDRSVEQGQPLSLSQRYFNPLSSFMKFWREVLLVARITHCGLPILARHAPAAIARPPDRLPAQARLRDASALHHARDQGITHACKNLSPPFARPGHLRSPRASSKPRRWLAAPRYTRASSW